MNGDVQRAREWIAGAQALLVTAGAGMGVDSGLPDFRGNEGFWKAYPPIKDRGIKFYEMANPAWFRDDPRLAWGFYGHRMNLYRDTDPHRGFEILRRFGERLPGGYFVYTSNVDGHFERAGFDPGNIVECHGSIHYLQCTGLCSAAIWSAEETEVIVDESTFLAEEPLPRCPDCGKLARPNILMFGDWRWRGNRNLAQIAEYQIWLDSVAAANLSLVVIEIGAGTAIPSVRAQSESRILGDRAKLIRINPREDEIPDSIGDSGLGFRKGGLEAIEELFS